MLKGHQVSLRFTQKTKAQGEGILAMSRGWQQRHSVLKQSARCGSYCPYSSVITNPSLSISRWQSPMKVIYHFDRWSVRTRARLKIFYLLFHLDYLFLTVFLTVYMYIQIPKPSFVMIPVKTSRWSFVKVFMCSDCSIANSWNSAIGMYYKPF